MADFEPLVINGDDVLNSGYVPPTKEDRAALNSTRGAADANLDKVMAMEPRDTNLLVFLTTVLMAIGITWKPQYQKYGTCVGQSMKLALDVLSAINKILYQMVWSGRFAVAGTYTFSRVEVARQPGKWEGSNGVQAATGAIKYGCLLLKSINLPEDSTDADENLAMKWTASREGVPANFEEMAGDILVQDVIHPDSIEQAAKLIQAGSPQLVGTTFIPTGQRNADGISPCKRSRGGHEMAVLAVRYKNGKPWCFLFVNSWSESWGTGPLTEDQPKGSVWVSAADYWTMIQEGDCSSLIGINGLKTE